MSCMSCLSLQLSSGTILNKLITNNNKWWCNTSLSSKQMYLGYHISSCKYRLVPHYSHLAPEMKQLCWWSERVLLSHLGWMGLSYIWRLPQNDLQRAQTIPDRHPSLQSKVRGNYLINVESSCAMTMEQRWQRLARFQLEGNLLHLLWW